MRLIVLTVISLLASTAPLRAVMFPNPYLTPILQEQCGVRNLPISAKLKAILRYAATETDLIVVVFSGGQCSNCRRRKGSHRHDNGNAADITLLDPYAGRTLDMRIAFDVGRMAAFVQAAVSAGATGIGAGKRYMGPYALHIGGGKPGTWGGAKWLRAAWAAGRKKPVSVKYPFELPSNQPQPVYPYGKVK